MNGAQALFKALTDAGIDTISRDTLIRCEFTKVQYLLHQSTISLPTSTIDSWSHPVLE